MRGVMEQWKKVAARACIALAGLVHGFFAPSYDAISIVPTFVLTQLTYLGGVFYSVDQLPPFFRALSLDRKSVV